MYPTYLMLTFLGFSTLYTGILSLLWTRRNLLNQSLKAILIIMTVFSGVGFYATLATGYWMYFNLFSLFAGFFFTVFAVVTIYPPHRFMFWMLAIAGLGNAAVSFAM
jgi:hypothetical protein